MSLTSLTRKALGLAVALVLGVVPVLGLAACGVNEEDAVKAAVSAQLDALKNADSDEIRSVLGDNTYSELQSSGVSPEEFYSACYKNFSYENNGVKIDGDNAKVSLKVTNIDMQQITSAWISDMTTYLYSSEALSDYQQLGENGVMQKAFQKLIGAMNADDAPTKTADVEIDLVKKDGQWNATDEQQLMNMLFAGADFSGLGM